MSIIKMVNLSYTNDNSNKVYSLIVSEDTTTVSRSYDVAFAYGRRGSNLKTGFKTQKTTREKAENVFQKFLEEKINKNYKVDGIIDFNNVDVTKKVVRDSLIIAVNYKDSDHETERVYIDASKLNPINPIDALILNKSKESSKNFNIRYCALGWDSGRGTIGESWLKAFQQDNSLCGPTISPDAYLEKKPPVVHKKCNFYIYYS